MCEKLTEQLPVRLTEAQREHLRKRVNHFKQLNLPGRITEGDIIRSLINADILVLAITTAEAGK